ncbi:MAG TPA: FAD-dependent oxidoreductase [Verrucomicrobiae bacterium]
MSLARKLPCTVESIANHGGGVYTVDLKPASLLPPFKPGQFLHLTVDDYDPSGFWPESRVFSIASSPLERKRIRVCYSVKGRYTARMERTLRVGGEVWIKLPYGEFVIDPADDVVLVAGGTGISAFTAFIEALRPEHPNGVWLVYGARSPELLLFREMILSQTAHVANFRVLLFTETGGEQLAAEMAGRPKPPGCLSGRITLDALWPLVPEAARKVFYLSGPPAMLTALSASLAARGLPPAHIRTDAWE